MPPPSPSSPNMATTKVLSAFIDSMNKEHVTEYIWALNLNLNVSVVKTLNNSEKC